MITLSHFKQVKNRLTQLLEQQQFLQKQVQEAREQGDLSENFAYTAGKTKLAQISKAIQACREILNKPVYQPVNNCKIQLGSQVKLNIDGIEQVYKIGSEGEQEQDNIKVLSSNALVGKKLIGLQAGEQVSIKTPAGKKVYTIVNVNCVE